MARPFLFILFMLCCTVALDMSVVVQRGRWTPQSEYQCQEWLTRLPDPSCMFELESSFRTTMLSAVTFLHDYHGSQREWLHHKVTSVSDSFFILFSPHGRPSFPRIKVIDTRAQSQSAHSSLCPLRESLVVQQSSCLGSCSPLAEVALLKTPFSIIF